jgi:hypothetical protein
MRRLLLLLGVASAALALAAPAYAARLSLADGKPVTVKGTGFHQRERVRVTVQENGRRVVRRVTASRRGTFTLRVPTATPPCGRWSGFATGSAGSRAILAGIMFPDCIVVQ